MPRLAVSLSAVLMLACGSGEPEPQVPPPPPPPTLADFAGTWESVSMLEGVPDSVVSRFRGSPGGRDWVLMLPDRDPIALQVWIDGDSLIALSEKYTSILRDDEMVQVRTATMLQEDGTLAGKLVATYDSPDGQQLVVGSVRSVRLVEDSAAAP